MQQKQQIQTQPPKSKPVARPDERGAIAVSSFLKISDPQTKKVFVETRA
jgi:hypothetical protein